MWFLCPTTHGTARTGTAPLPARGRRNRDGVALLDSYLPYPWPVELAPERFYTELYRLHNRR
jgi:hypothetical protein